VARDAVHGSCASRGRQSQTVPAAAGEFEHELRPMPKRTLKSRKVIETESRLATRGRPIGLSSHGPYSAERVLS
jgi:hypothetical protein